MKSLDESRSAAAGDVQEALRRLSPLDPGFATQLVTSVLRAARTAGASDVHIDPASDELVVRWRLDGVLQPLVRVDRKVAPNVVARLKVLAGLLTYEMALPQEGRIWDEALGVEVRVSTFPTLYGERAVLRLLGASYQNFASLQQLGLPAGVLKGLERELAATSGAILIVGPAGSGKTTTGYACLRHIVSQTSGGRSIASLEDPVEVAVPGVAQSQVDAAAGFDMAKGLRNLLRLDPEVILIGEMRDQETAQVALQAALTGQLVVTTFHASNCQDAINRLVEIGIPNYAVRNAVRLVVAQRLLRRLCRCAQPASMPEHGLGLDVNRCWVPVGCNECHQTGYLGRSLIADCGTSDRLASDEALWASAKRLIEAGTTSPAEAIRILGLPKDESLP